MDQAAERLTPGLRACHYADGRADLLIARSLVAELCAAAANVAFAMRDGAVFERDYAAQRLAAALKAMDGRMDWPPAEPGSVLAAMDEAISVYDSIGLQMRMRDAKAKVRELVAADVEFDAAVAAREAAHIGTGAEEFGAIVARKRIAITRRASALAAIGGVA